MQTVHLLWVHCEFPDLMPKICQMWPQSQFFSNVIGPEKPAKAAKNQLCYTIAGGTGLVMVLQFFQLGAKTFHIYNTLLRILYSMCA
jgi:hypothetical protein